MAVKGKNVFLFLSAIFSVIAIYAHDPTITTYCPLSDKIVKAAISYLFHLQQFFLWSLDIPLFEQLSTQQTLYPVLTIIFIIIATMAMAKRLPYFFVGWFWYLITLSPVVGIVQCGHTDLILPHYAYQASIGINIMLAWGIPLFIPNRSFKKIILFTTAIALLTFLVIITWQMSSYCKSYSTYSSINLQVTNDNYMQQNNLGVSIMSNDGIFFNTKLLAKAIKCKLVFPDEKKLNDAIDYYDKVISQNPDNASDYNNRGTVYNKLGRHQLAIDDYSHAIRLKSDYSIAYSNRSVACHMQGFKGKFCSKELSYCDLEKACSLGNCNLFKFAKKVKARTTIDNTHGYNDMWTYLNNLFSSIKSDNAHTYNDRGIENSKKGQYKIAIENFNEAISLKPDFADAYENRGLTYAKEGRYQLAIEDFNQAVRLKPDFTYYYINRGAIYFIIQNKEQGCIDAQKACSLGSCELLEMARRKKYCR